MPLAPFSFRTEFKDGRSLEIIPTFVHPFNVDDIYRLEKDATPSFEAVIEGNNIAIDGVVSPGHATMRAKASFSMPTTIFALVPGGWVPLPFAIPARFLVDRNVVISLRKIREGKTTANIQALQWWTDFFAQGTGLFNPLPYAFESGYRRKPTMTEFVSAFEEGVSELRSALPKCHIVEFDEALYRAAYAQLEAFDERNEREIRFLQAVCPLVMHRVPRHAEAEVANLVIRSADTHKVGRASLPTLAVLSCLYEDVHGATTAIGKRILKPKATYSEADAFNALSDLHHIELAAAGQALFGRETFSLCTCDRPMALMWSALSPKTEFAPDGTIEFTFDLTNDLFSRLSENELLSLRQLLCA